MINDTETSYEGCEFFKDRVVGDTFHLMCEKFTKQTETTAVRESDNTVWEYDPNTHVISLMTEYYKFPDPDVSTMIPSGSVDITRGQTPFGIPPEIQQPSSCCSDGRCCPTISTWDGIKLIFKYLFVRELAIRSDIKDIEQVEYRKKFFRWQELPEHYKWV